MQQSSTFEVLIPRPAQAWRGEGVFRLGRSIGVQAEGEEFEHLREVFAYYGIRAVPGGELVVADADGGGGLPAEGFRLEITDRRILLRGNDAAGRFYGLSALEQMLAAGCSRGLEEAALECGTVEDRPRFAYRGFMLDSARHFQGVPTLKKVLSYLSRYRINRFHWHLVDGNAWRLESEVAPQLAGLPSGGGHYTAADVREVAEHARRLHITIVPEIEMPGHSSGILSLLPQYSCTPEDPGAEFCLGNPEGRRFLRTLIDEFIDRFPDSPVIHLGGDEADTDHWERCPRCRSLAQSLGGLSMRQLENRFMDEMAAHVLSRGRIPMGWGTESVLPGKMIVQVWRSDHELIRNFREGHNPLVASVHYDYYFDYPLNSNEPDFNWMLGLPEETVYRAEPSFTAADLLGNALLGPEAALWTEIVPEWRVLEKIVPRLPAFAESAWTPSRLKQYTDFLRRRQTLDAAGYVRFLLR